MRYIRRIDDEILIMMSKMAPWEESKQEALINSSIEAIKRADHTPLIVATMLVNAIIQGISEDTRMTLKYINTLNVFADFGFLKYVAIFVRIRLICKFLREYVDYKHEIDRIWNLISALQPSNYFEFRRSEYVQESGQGIKEHSHEMDF